MNAMLPQHVAVIMDGNGRWASQRSLSRAQGHRAGAEAIRALTSGCRKRGIPFVTVYAFSKENWQRPAAEVNFLFDLFCEFLRVEIQELEQQDIRLDMLGDMDDLPFLARQAIKHAMRKTRHCQSMRLTLALSYSGRSELVRAVQQLLLDNSCNNTIMDVRTLAQGLEEETLRSYLYAPDLPDPDLLIRTSGEQRLSNFLLFQSAYTELYFTPALWPDFDDAELEKALADYAQRQRRFGTL